MTHPIEPINGPLYVVGLPVLGQDGGAIQVFPYAISRQILDPGEGGIPFGQFGMRVVHQRRDGVVTATVQTMGRCISARNLDDLVHIWNALS